MEDIPMRKTLLAAAAVGLLTATGLGIAPASADSYYSYTVYPDGSRGYATYPNATYSYTTLPAPSYSTYPAPPPLPQIGQTVTTYSSHPPTVTYSTTPVYTPAPSTITSYGPIGGPVYVARPFCNPYDVNRPGVTTGCQ
jgi:hypothetical protein